MSLPPRDPDSSPVGNPAARPTSDLAPPPARLIAERVFNAVERFVHVEAVSGIVLLLSATAALVWANSPAAASYHQLWDTSVPVAFGRHFVAQPVHFWINDALMTVFFLVAGLEIRREIHEGALASLDLASLPLAAAFGGVAVPALLFVAAAGDPQLRPGWAIPTATDIAFAVGVLALLGRSIPGSVRVLLLSLAIIDDIVAVILIAVFYSSGLDYSGLFIVAAGVVLTVGLRQMGIGAAFAYVFPGAIVWLGFLKTGVHPALAGVVLGLMTPAKAAHGSGLPPPVVRVQIALHPWVAYGIMPLFALANAGVEIRGLDLSDSRVRSVMSGVLFALWLGKPLGIVLGSQLALRLGWSRLPPGLGWRDVLLVGCLGGVGFTMSVFIATLALDDASLLAASKAGVLGGSAAAGITGLVVGRWFVTRVR